MGSGAWGRSLQALSLHPVFLLLVGCRVSGSMTTETFVKDIKPGLKNLNLIFIVLETGGYAGAVGPLRGFSGLGGKWGRISPLFLTCSLGGRAHPKTWLTPNPSPIPQPRELQCSYRVDRTLVRSKPPVPHGPLSIQRPLYGAGSSTPHPHPSLPQRFGSVLFVQLFPHPTNISGSHPSYHSPLRLSVPSRQSDQDKGRSRGSDLQSGRQNGKHQYLCLGRRG